jgi:hypothetical protein
MDALAHAIRLLGGLKEQLEALRPALAEAAQKPYDAWEQDEEGMDPELGAGGICQDVAAELCDAIGQAGIDCYTQHAEIGEQHVWAVAYDEATQEAYLVDIPFCVYESGGGYNWTKLPDVVFEPSDIVIESLDFEDAMAGLE